MYQPKLFKNQLDHQALQNSDVKIKRLLLIIIDNILIDQFFFLATTTTTTNRPSPPWLITSQPPMWSTIKPTSRPSTPVIPKVFKAPPLKSSTSPVTKTTSTTSAPPLPPQPEPEDIFSKNDNFNPIPEEITTILYTTYVPKRINRKYSIGKNKNANFTTFVFFS